MSTSAPLRLVVLVSGNGSNLQAILDAIGLGKLNAEVIAVVSNRKRAYALQRAEQADISTAYVPLKPYLRRGLQREDYDADVAELVSGFNPDCIVCAGWMHIFSSAFLDVFPGRVVNLHPALPGQFPGKDAIGDAFAAFQRGEITHTGVMVHIVVPEVDAGPVLQTATVSIQPGDDRDALEQRIHAVEHTLLVDVLCTLSAQRDLPEEKPVNSSKRAILSVWDKTGLVELGRGLAELGYELVASGGTARKLAEAGLDVVAVNDVTGHPEILGGRVKTLHPAIHGGILARGTEEHLSELADHGIGAVDVVVCNLYPFQRTVADPDVTELGAIEQIDIGGVTLLRAAAKNYERVCIVCDPGDYGPLVQSLADGEVDKDARRKLALKAFRHTAEYDVAISGWLATKVEGPAALPEVMTLQAHKVQTLRYGENSHQEGAVYRFAGASAPFEQIGGQKALSYNNVADLEAAWGMPAEFDRPAVAIIKHANPSGLAVADDLITAFDRALKCDPVSAFGSIIAVNRPVDLDFVRNFGKLFVEVLAAPSFSEEALKFLARRKKNCRVMRWTGQSVAPAHVIREMHGGLLVQTADTKGVVMDEWTVASERQPTEAELNDLKFAWVACKHVKSNAIVFAKDEATVGVGAGQMNRVDSVRLAGWRAGDMAKGAVLASDAFFPFPDGIEAAVEFGITAVVQPGGSIRDELVIEKVNELGLAMMFTGTRHFRH